MDIKINYFIKCMKHYASFKGRASRAEFWYFILYWIIFYVVIIIIDTTIGSFNYVIFD